jgi:hypothetical protein
VTVKKARFFPEFTQNAFSGLSGSKAPVMESARTNFKVKTKNTENNPIEHIKNFKGFLACHVSSIL